MIHVQACVWGPTWDNRIKVMPRLLQACAKYFGQPGVLADGNF